MTVVRYRSAVGSCPLPIPRKRKYGFWGFTQIICGCHQIICVNLSPIYLLVVSCWLLVFFCLRLTANCQLVSLDTGYYTSALYELCAAPPLCTTHCFSFLRTSPWLWLYKPFYPRPSACPFSKGLRI